MAARLMYEHRCSNPDCGALNEHLNAYVDKTDICPHCGAEDNRVMSAPKLDVLHMGVDAAGLPTAGAKWAKMHREAAGHGHGPRTS